MKSFKRTLAFVALSTMCVAAGCASTATSAAKGGSSPRARGSSNQVSAEELVAASSQNVYDALKKVRPQWLSDRGSVSVSAPTETASADVYMNGSNVGTVDYLRDVDVNDVASLRFWEPGEASARFGMGHARGVIEITRK